MTLENYKAQKEQREKTYKKWRRLVNMSVQELKDFMKTDEGKKAGLTKSEAREQGIKSGQESAEWIIKMKKTPFIQWTDEMHEWASRQVSFISRMSKVDGPLYNPKGAKTRKHTSLLIWGHNPSKKEGGQVTETNNSSNNEELINSFKGLFNMSIKEMEEFKKWLDKKPQYKPNVRVHPTDLAKSKENSSRKSSSIDVGIVINHDQIIQSRQKKPQDWTSFDIKFAEDFIDLYNYYKSKPERLTKEPTILRWKNMGIDFNKMSSTFNPETPDIRFKDGGPITMETKHPKYDITYKIEPTEKGRCRVIESSPNWEEDNEFTFVSKEDAVEYVEMQTGKKVEIDPERYFLKDTEMKRTGGELSKGIKTEQEHKKTLQDLYDHKINVTQAIRKTALDHIMEHRNYYTELNKMEQKFMRGGAISIEDDKWKINSKYSNMEIAGKIREYIKEYYPECKASVSKDAYGINVRLMQAPYYPFTDDVTNYEKEKMYIQVNNYYVPESTKLSDPAKEFFMDIVEFSDLYNFGIGHSKNFYLELAVGKWDQPFVQNEKRGAKSPKKPRTPKKQDPQLPEKPKTIFGKPSTDESVWDAKYKVGDRVKVRFDFCNDSPNDDNSKALSGFDYDSKENDFKITYITQHPEMKRPQNPSGFLYRLDNGQGWEGKDLEPYIEPLPVPKDTDPEMKKKIEEWVSGTKFLKGTDLQFDTTGVKDTPESVHEIMDEEKDLMTLYNLSNSYSDDSVKEIRNTINDLEVAKNLFLEEQLDLDTAMNNYFWFASGKRSDFVPADVTESKTFKAWFGDWQTKTDEPVSKVVDSDGKPLKVYHGTKNPYSFLRFKFDMFPVMYFAENKSYAEWFANLGNGILYECYLDIKFLADFRFFGYNSISWSQIVKASKEIGVELPEKHPVFEENYRGPFWSYLRNDHPHQTLIKAIKAAGYTGLAHIENNPSDLLPNGEENYTAAFMTFSSEQSKLSTTLDWSEYNPIIFMKKGGQIKKDNSLMNKIKNLK